MAAAAVSLSGSIVCGNSSPARAISTRRGGLDWRRTPWWASGALIFRKARRALPLAGSRADDSSAPQEMTVESALEILGLSEGASFDEIVRAKNAVLASIRDDMEAVAQVEAAYEMLLMQSLSRRRSGKVENSRIRYADVRTSKNTGTNALPEWLQARIKNVPVSIESPSTSNLGIQAGVYGALMLFTYVSGASTTSTGPYAGAEVSGLIIATSIGASLYFLSKKRLGLGKAAVLTVGGLVAGAAVGSAVEQWLQVDIVPFYGIHSPAIIVSEFILLSQFLVSLYLT
ncbi:protein CHAPERONE-LIKE PROTEIN OF POR1, chloroplastic-like isoform X3 [Zingiber officinale]|uniref:protein CHAPERONE-LIKE PROTEIN OF POR1, chloroplastic-like isoform X3 n=1 Tax=Zingiber officinale TaxID=94328 RepID=UPI001C4DA39C|nr:protein CHAPERONE-LIKE PROTEIN OF POR1, chloroplastic-like isoform X3 [Zingiber officinale]